MKCDYEAKVLADSINLDTGDRLTTFELTFPRFILAEVNTHRMFSRNSASSRAIPVHKRIAAIRANPFVPMAFCANKRGMQAGDELDEQAASAARTAWLMSCATACQQAEAMAKAKVHKQWANRLLEPFAWHTAIVSATEWANFFALRAHPDAQPEFRTVAEMAQELYREHTPEELKPGMWHLPMLAPMELNNVRALSFDWDAFGTTHSNWPELLRWIKISVGRCARVSYLTHDGKRDPKADIELCDRLHQSGHMSPLEHAAVARDGRVRTAPDGINRWGNFTGFMQYRKTIFGEAVFNG